MGEASSYFYIKIKPKNITSSLQRISPLFIGSRPLHENRPTLSYSASQKTTPAKNSGISDTKVPLASGQLPLASGVIAELAAQLFSPILYFKWRVLSCSRFVDLDHEKLMNSRVFPGLLICCYFARIVSVSRDFRRRGLSGPMFCKYSNIHLR